MSISQANQVDYLFKKIGYSVAATTTAALKSPSNETIPSPLTLRGDIIWQQSALIPSTPPSTSSGVVAVYRDSLSNTVKTTGDSTSPSLQTWKTGLTNWIDPSFGSNYQVQVFSASSSASSPQTTGTQLYPDGTGNDDEWFFDYDAGLLTFPDNIPTTVTNNPTYVIYIVGYRYTGQIGISNFVGNISFGNISTSGLATLNSLVVNNSSQLNGALGVTGTVTSSGVVNVTNTTASTSSSTGALTVAGGTGVAGNVYVGNAVVAGNGIMSVSTFTGTYSDGILVDYTSGLGRVSVGTGDGISFYNATDVTRSLLLSIASNGNVVIPATTATSGTTTGALTVAGGAGIAGDIQVGGNVYAGNLNIGTGTATLSTITSSANVTINATGGIVNLNATGALQLPSGITSQELALAAGAIRYNQTTSSIEWFNGSAWTTMTGSIADQQITPDGVSQTFTLNQTATNNGVLVSINGTLQQPGLAYNVSGTSITFSEVPLTSDLIDVRFISLTIAPNLSNYIGNVFITGSFTVSNAFTTGSGIQNTPIGNAIPSTGAFTTLSATSANVTNGITSATHTITGTTGSTSTTTGALTVAGGVGIQGNLYVGGNIYLAGNTTVVNQTITTQTVGNLIVGPGLGFTATNANIQYSGSFNNYLQMQMQNRSNGAVASTDYVATPNNAGSDTDTYIDMGINGSGYVATYPYGYSFANDGYLYVQGNTTTGGGNLMLATMNSSNMIFHAIGGQNQANIVHTTTSTSLVVNTATTSTSTTTGALIVNGGTGIAGNLYVGGSIVGTATQATTSQFVTGLTSANVTSALGFTPYNATNPSGYLTSITSSMVTSALGFTPYNATNPSGYLTSITSGMVTTALGFTPYNATNPSGYLTSITSGMVTTALGFTPYNATNPSGYITSSGTAYNISQYTINQNVGSSNSPTFTGLTINGAITATGDITAFYSSDRTLKSNVTPIPNSLDKVMAIGGYEFDWTDDYITDNGGEDGYLIRKHDVGVIAQEVELVLPEVVGTRPNGIKAVKYDRLVALLIEAVKDQQKQIDELRSQLLNQQK